MAQYITIKSMCMKTEAMLNKWVTLLWIMITMSANLKAGSPPVLTLNITTYAGPNRIVRFDLGHFFEFYRCLCDDRVQGCIPHVLPHGAVSYIQTTPLSLDHISWGIYSNRYTCEVNQEGNIILCTRLKYSSPLCSHMTGCTSFNIINGPSPCVRAPGIVWSSHQYLSGLYNEHLLAVEPCNEACSEIPTPTLGMPKTRAAATTATTSTTSAKTKTTTTLLLEDLSLPSALTKDLLQTAHPASNNNRETAHENQSNSGNETALIVGLALGVLMCISVLLSLAILFFKRRRIVSQASKSKDTPDAPVSTLTRPKESSKIAHPHCEVYRQVKRDNVLLATGTRSQRSSYFQYSSGDTAQSNPPFQLTDKSNVSIIDQLGDYSTGRLLSNATGYMTGQINSVSQNIAQSCLESGIALSSHKNAEWMCYEEIDSYDHCIAQCEPEYDAISYYTNQRTVEDIGDKYHFDTHSTEIHEERSNKDHIDTLNTGVQVRRTCSDTDNIYSRLKEESRHISHPTCTLPYYVSDISEFSALSVSLHGSYLLSEPAVSKCQNTPLEIVHLFSTFDKMADKKEREYYSSKTIAPNHFYFELEEDGDYENGSDVSREDYGCSYV